MRLSLFIVTLLLIMNAPINAQETKALPYDQIGSYPTEFNAGNVVGRFLDALGYRYYWATEGITEKDLNFRPSEDARSFQETNEHLLGLSNTILNAALKKPNTGGGNQEALSFEALRAQTLQNIHQASEAFKAGADQNFEEHKIVFQRDNGSREFPVWNVLNGPIADAIYHVGQLVSFRRASGNPMNPKVNVFMGKNRE